MLCKGVAHLLHIFPHPPIHHVEHCTTEYRPTQPPHTHRADGTECHGEHWVEPNEASYRFEVLVEGCKTGHSGAGGGTYRGNEVVTPTFAAKGEILVPIELCG